MVSSLFILARVVDEKDPSQQMMNREEWQISLGDELTRVIRVATVLIK